MEWEKFSDLLLELVLIYNKDGELVACNRAAEEKLGYDGSELPVPMYVVLPMLFGKPEEMRAGNGIPAGPFLSGKPTETEFYRKNQTCFPAEARFAAADGRFICTAVDVSKRKEAEREIARIKEEMAEALKYRSEFVSNITHELRTPVNGMMGLTKSLMDTPLTPSQLETLHIIDRCCVNMTKMIGDLLDFSKIEAGKLRLEEKPFAFREFLNKAMAFQVSLVNEKGLKLVLHVADDIPAFLIGDELRLTQILTNLIGNAVKFTAIGYIALEVTMTMETDDEVELFFMVMDTGIGIAKKNMDKLFQSFSQVDASITRRFGGTGLGLSICRRLVEQMGGSIKVDSEEGKGSAFSFNVTLKKAKEDGGLSDVRFPSGKFVYEGSGRYSGNGRERGAVFTGQEEQASGWSFLDEIEDTEAIYQFGTRENLDEIRKNMEKLLICIEMENWEKAENFATIVKSLISEDNPELKRAAFRLVLTVRKEDHDKALRDFGSLKELLSETPLH